MNQINLDINQHSPMDPVSSVDRIARAVERILTFDGWIGEEKIFEGEDLVRISESIARRAAEPANFVNQGFHNTSVTQSKMRQMLETDPAGVAETLADLVTTGRARVGGELIEVEPESLKLDLEARLAGDETIITMGLRDAAGQLFDLLFTQAVWCRRRDQRYEYRFHQEELPDKETQATGEKLYRLDNQVGGRQEPVYEGPCLGPGEALLLSQITDGEYSGVILHTSVAGPYPGISNEAELQEAVTNYHARTKRPAQVVVFANNLFEASYPSNGHDLHMITAICHGESKQFFCQSFWGRQIDAGLNGIEASVLLRAMVLPDRIHGIPQAYDKIPAHQRVIDPAYPVRPADRAEKMITLKQTLTNLCDRQLKLQNSPEARLRKKYREDVLEWERAYKEHVKLFGESIPFSRPRPEPPGNL
ncbi:MAG: hypothetical protein KC777_00150 [Cyanobacteria bacterium HKST-UBA02]|nr:hypothetical protein [Cyanobacteria bacterium HKST-UBA02]